MVKRAFIEPSLLKTAVSGSLVLPDDVAHRFSQVLRLPEGSPVELFDGTGLVVRGVLHLREPVSVDEASLVQQLPNPVPLWVAQAVVKMDKLEQVVQRSTELGATGIILFDAERSQVHFKDKGPAKRDRLERIANDAARQAGRADVPKVQGPVSFIQLVEIVKKFEGLSVLGDPDADQHLSARAKQDHEILIKNGALIVIGPEGGLADGETERLRIAGARLLRWGPYVLRTETAALAALSIVQVEFGCA